MSIKHSFAKGTPTPSWSLWRFAGTGAILFAIWWLANWAMGRKDNSVFEPGVTFLVPLALCVIAATMAGICMKLVTGLLARWRRSRRREGQVDQAPRAT